MFGKILAHSVSTHPHPILAIAVDHVVLIVVFGRPLVRTRPSRHPLIMGSLYPQLFVRKDEAVRNTYRESPRADGYVVAEFGPLTIGRLVVNIEKGWSDTRLRPQPISLLRCRSKSAVGVIFIQLRLRKAWLDCVQSKRRACGMRDS